MWISWLILILVLSLTPGDQLPLIKWNLISISSLAHFTFYFVLLFLMLLAFNFKSSSPDKNKMNQNDLRLYGVLILVGIAIGTSIELVQGNFIYRRYFDIEDIVVNVIGTIFGALGYKLIGRKLV